MKDIAEAFTIMARYGNPHNPTHCSHDYLYVDMKWKSISKEDRKRLKQLGFFKDKEMGEGCIGSFRFGSC